MKTELPLVRHIEPYVNTFVQMEYQKYLTVDMLFTTLMLNQLPDGEMRRIIVHTMHDHLESDGDDEDTDDSTTVSSSTTARSTSALKHYNFLTKSLRKYQEALDHGKGPRTVSKKDSVELNDAHAASVQGPIIITHDDGKYTMDTTKGIKYPYVALKTLCTACHGPGSTKPHNPRCYAKACKTCGLFGHPHWACQA